MKSLVQELKDRFDATGKRKSLDNFLKFAEDELKKVVASRFARGGHVLVFTDGTEVIVGNVTPTKLPVLNTAGTSVDKNRGEHEMFLRTPQTAYSDDNDIV